MTPRDCEDVYSKTPEKDIPWASDEPPRALVELLESGGVEPCAAIDMGCGAGGYAIYLARRGFEVTGVDLSPTAIETARKKAARQGVDVDFIVADVLGDLDEVRRRFDFLYDWSLLHHIEPKDRDRYVSNARRLLKPGGKYLSVCFSDKDPFFGGKGKSRETSIGTVLYFSSLGELEELFRPYFEILEHKIIATRGKRGEHKCNYFLMRRP